MDLHILSLPDAIEFLPDKPTYAIRIFSSWDNQRKIRPLQSSELYTSINQYVFDDNDRAEVGPIWFDKGLAKKIMEDFKENKSSAEALLVHCSIGKNRSPAIAIALNEIFNLGHNSEELKQKYGGFNGFNRHVYKTLLNSA